MFDLQPLIITRRSVRRELEALKRRFEAFKRRRPRALAAAVLRPAASHIAKLWEIALAKKKPVPDPVDCVHIMAGTGFRPLTAWNVLHGYIDHCQRCRHVPSADEIIEKLLPPGKKFTLSTVFPTRFP